MLFFAIQTEIIQENSFLAFLFKQWVVVQLAANATSVTSHSQILASAVVSQIHVSSVMRQASRRLMLRNSQSAAALSFSSVKTFHPKPSKQLVSAQTDT